MVTKDQAIKASMFYHKKCRNADGTALRARASGKCKVWKTRPDDFRQPVKYGLRESFYITPFNAHRWFLEDPTELPKLAKSVGLMDNTPLDKLMDKLMDAGREKDAQLVRYFMENGL